MRDQKLRRRSSFILPRGLAKKCPAADSSRCRPPPRIAERRDSSIVDRQIAQCQIEKYEARKSKFEIGAVPLLFGFLIWHFDYMSGPLSGLLQCLWNGG